MKMVCTKEVEVIAATKVATVTATNNGNDNNPYEDALEQVVAELVPAPANDDNDAAQDYDQQVTAPQRDTHTVEDVVVEDQGNHNRSDAVEDDNEGDNNEFHYEIFVLRHHSQTKKCSNYNHHEDDTMSVVSCLTSSTLDHDYSSSNNDGGVCSPDPLDKAQHTSSLKQRVGNYCSTQRPGTIVKTFLSGHRKKGKQKQPTTSSRPSATPTDLTTDIEHGLSKTTVFKTRIDDESSGSSVQQKQQRQKQTISSSKKDEMKGFMIAISIACVGILLLGLGCFLFWWTSHHPTNNNDDRQGFDVTSSSTIEEGPTEHFIPGHLRQRWLNEEVAYYSSWAPEEKVLEYMLKTNSFTRHE